MQRAETRLTEAGTGGGQRRVEAPRRGAGRTNTHVQRSTGSGHTYILPPTHASPKSDRLWCIGAPWLSFCVAVSQISMVGRVIWLPSSACPPTSCSECNMGQAEMSTSSRTRSAQGGGGGGGWLWGRSAAPLQPDTKERAHHRRTLRAPARRGAAAGPQQGRSRAARGQREGSSRVQRQSHRQRAGPACPRARPQHARRSSTRWPRCQTIPGSTGAAARGSTSAP